MVLECFIAKRAIPGDVEMTLGTRTISLRSGRSAFASLIHRFSCLQVICADFGTLAVPATLSVDRIFGRPVLLSPVLRACHNNPLRTV